MKRLRALFTLFLSVSFCFILGVNAFAASEIVIAAPRGWYTQNATVTVNISNINNSNIEKVEFKTDQQGQWQDITGDIRAYGKAEISITDDTTVYVNVNAKDGNMYSQILYVNCFDREAPAISASLDSKTLHVQANDALSGVMSIFVNGYEFDGGENGTLTLRLRDYLEADELEVSVYAVDYAGNQSRIITLDNPYYLDGSEENGGETAPEPKKGGSVTPTDGTGTVIENSEKTPGEREFFTITTEAGGEYYIVVDKEKDEKNVYLLSAVTEDDLMGLTKSGAAVKQTTPEPEPKPEPQPEPEATPTPTKTNNGSVGVFPIILVALAAGGGGYYFKIYKPKHDASGGDYDEDALEDEDENEDYGDDEEESEYQEDDSDTVADDSMIDDSDDEYPRE